VLNILCDTKKRRPSRQHGDSGKISVHENSRIYRYLAVRLREMTLEGSYQSGDALPSSRQIASEQRINLVTVSKAYQILVNDDLLEKKRGLGMYVGHGVRVTITGRRAVCFDDPEFQNRAQRLIFIRKDLLQEVS